MQRYILPMTGMVAILAAGIVHGCWTERWGVSDEPGASAERLTQANVTLPDWEEQAVDQGSRREKWIAGQFYKRYVHRQSGQMVSAYLVCGKPGPISVHTPDVCYGASGFDVLSPSKITTSIGTHAVEFHTAEFRKKNMADPLHLRIFWAWNGHDGWSTPEDPRSTFAHQRVLHKLYLIREVSGHTESIEEDPCVELMKQLLPELDRQLFAKVEK